MQRISKTRVLLAVALTSLAATAGAQEPNTLHAVTVERPSPYFMRALINCTPPTHDPVCERFHGVLRTQFTRRELGMLFGPSTAYLEYRASYDRVKARYAALLRNIEENGLPPPRVEPRVPRPALHAKPNAARPAAKKRRALPAPTVSAAPAPYPENTALPRP